MLSKKRKAATAPSSSVFKRCLRSQEQELPKLALEDENEKYTFINPRKQSFSIPESIIYYIIKNESNPECHIKLIKTCKLLFRMSRIVPVESVQNNKLKFIPKNYLNQIKETYINFGKESFCKFWIYDKLEVNSPQNLSSKLTQCIYKFVLRELHLFSQILFYQELEILAGSGKLKKISFENNIVKDVDGNVTHFEKVFKVLYCENMINIALPIENHGIYKETASQIAEYMGSNGREYFIGFKNVPQDFDMRVFYHFIKTNMNQRQHSVHLNFHESISDDYNNDLDKIIDEILQIRGVYAHTIPMIFYRRQTLYGLRQLYDMRFRSTEGIFRKLDSF